MLLLSTGRKTLELLLWRLSHLLLLLLLHVLLLLLMHLLLLRGIHVRIPVIASAGGCRLNPRGGRGRHAQKVIVRCTCGGSLMVVIVKVQERTARIRGGCRRRRSEKVVDAPLRGNRLGNTSGRRSRGCRSRCVVVVSMEIIVVVIVVVIVLHTDPTELHNDSALPERDRLAFLDDVHPDRHGILFAVGSGNQRRFETIVILARQR
mmetsp:Transcript_18458/g.40191  ORF Transcript_18458/g.40191 Transcript_18458/m.40191 type:complete len:206 (-) Transcript_18458:219-836(-)